MDVRAAALMGFGETPVRYVWWFLIGVLVVTAPAALWDWLRGR